MTNRNHTPGPWEAVDKRPDGFRGYSIFHGDQFVAHVGDSDSVTPIDANARLIAAAPELLEACELLIEQYEASGDFTIGGKLTNRPFSMARAAIAKATGEPK